MDTLGWWDACSIEMRRDSIFLERRLSNIAIVGGRDKNYVALLYS